MWLSDRCRGVCVEQGSVVKVEAGALMAQVGVPLAAEQNPTLWRPVSWTAERREAVSPIPGVRASGETLISRRVRETGIGSTGRPSCWCPASLIKWPNNKTLKRRHRGRGELR
jgi:hypothetical protein